jgi:hypothetical protein
MLMIEFQKNLHLVASVVFKVETVFGHRFWYLISMMRYCTFFSHDILGPFFFTSENRSKEQRWISLALLGIHARCPSRSTAWSVQIWELWVVVTVLVLFFNEKNSVTFESILLNQVE